MELTLIRKFFKDTYTIGRLYNESAVICATLEDRVRNLSDYNKDGDFDDDGEGKIYGQTAIPCGRYKVIVNDSPGIKRRLPLLLDVPGFTGIRIHHGKNADWSSGCILVGENTMKATLTNGPYYEDLVIRLIDKATEQGEQTFISIKE